MPGAHLTFDRAPLQAALTTMMAQAEEQSAAHAHAEPMVPATATGRDFADTADRLREVLQRVHLVGQRRIDGLHDAARAGVEQVEALATADDRLSDRFKARES